MTQQLLDRSDILTHLQQMRRKRMAKRMHGYPFGEHRLAIFISFASPHDHYVSFKSDIFRWPVLLDVPAISRARGIPVSETDRHLPV